MRRLSINILGVSEVRWKECGKLPDEETFLYSGGTTHQNGVGILLDKQTSKCLLGFCPISERVMIVKIKGWPFNISIIQVYAPTSLSPEEEIDSFYEQLQEAKKLCKSQEIVIGSYQLLS